MRRSLVAIPCLAAFAIPFVPARATAQPPPPPVSAVPLTPRATQIEQTTTETTVPNVPLIVSGVVVFGAAYIPSVVVASTSGLDADRTLAVPFAGPWMDLTQRPGCAGDCARENAHRVLLVADGVFQAVGGLTTLAGFLLPAHQRRTVRTFRPAASWSVSPATFSNGGYGLKVTGAF